MSRLLHEGLEGLQIRTMVQIASFVDLQVVTGR